MTSNFTMNHRPIYANLSGNIGLGDTAPLRFLCKRLLNGTPNPRDEPGGSSLTRGN